MFRPFRKLTINLVREIKSIMYASKAVLTMYNYVVIFKRTMT